MVTVPADTAVITPEEDIVATDGLLVLHVPPLPVVVTVAVPPAQTDVAPLMMPAKPAVPTVTVCMAMDEPQLLATT